MERTGQGLRDSLFDEIESLKSGNSTPARAKAVAVLANTILNEVEVEMRVKSFNAGGGLLLLAGQGMALGTKPKEGLPEPDIEEMESALKGKKEEIIDLVDSEESADDWEGLDNKPRGRNLSKIPSPSEYENTKL